jgi:hypothetical protein
LSSSWKEAFDAHVFAGADDYSAGLFSILASAMPEFGTSRPAGTISGHGLCFSVNPVKSNNYRIVYDKK